MGNNGQGSGASAAADGYVCQRPKPEERHFTSKAVEEVIAGTKKKLKDPKLAWMFEIVSRIHWILLLILR